MTLTEWIEKLIQEHKETGTFLSYVDFKTMVVKELPIMKSKSLKVWHDAYNYYSHMYTKGDKE